MSMPLVPHGKAHASDVLDGFEVVVPAQRNLVVIAFLALWLLGWVQGELFAVSALLSDRTPLGAQLFIAAWLALWTLGGLAALFAVLWLALGSERLVLGPAGLRLRREVFGLGRWKTLRPEEVRGLRAFGADMPAAARAGMRATGFGGGGGVLFEVHGRVYRFGFSLTAEESGAVVRALRQHYPFPSGDPQPPGERSESAA